MRCLLDPELRLQTHQNLLSIPFNTSEEFDNDRLALYFEKLYTYHEKIMLMSYPEYILR